MYVSDGIVIAVLAYLIGSVPFGILLARIFGLPDPRTIGSGNIGATNVLRTGRKEVALLTLLLDMGKGVAAAMLAEDWLGLASAVALAVLMAALGHMFSPWLKFKGGKGVATILGGVLVLNWAVGVIFCITWLAVFMATRFVSLASMIALMTIPVVTLVRFGAPSACFLAVAAAIAIYKHRANIARLRNGEEPKMMEKKHA